MQTEGKAVGASTEGMKIRCVDAFSDLMSHYVERIQNIGFCSSP